RRRGLAVEAASSGALDSGDRRSIGTARGGRNVSAPSVAVRSLARRRPPPPPSQPRAPCPRIAPSPSPRAPCPQTPHPVVAAGALPADRPRHEGDSVLATATSRSLRC